MILNGQSASSTPSTPATDANLAPESTGDPAIDRLAAETVAALEKEFAFQEPVEAESTPSETVDPSGVATSPGEPTSAPSTTPPPAKTEDPVERGLERLVAREVEVRERERAIEAREAAIKAAEGRKDPAIESMLAKMRTDPEAALRAAGVDVDHAMRLIIAKRLGDKAPPELRGAVRDAEIQRELDELRQHNARLAQAQESQRFFNQVSSEARQYVVSGGVSKDVPSLAEIAKDSPDWVHEMVIEEITRDAQEKLSRQDHSAALLSFQDAAKRLEKKLNPVLSRGKSSTPTDATPARQPVATTPPTTPQSNPKPTLAPKPIFPWQVRDDQELLDAGLKAGIMEFRKSSENR